MTRIAMLGGGVMGEAIIAALTRVDPDVSVVLAEKRPERAAELQARYGITAADAAHAVTDADVVIVVVKPQDVIALLTEVGPRIAPGTLVISIAAGIQTSTIRELAPGAAIVRAMPNTPARIERGVTGISPAVDCPSTAVDRAGELLAALGTVVRIPEDLQDAFTAVAGSGPAYVFYLAESMIAAAVDLGLPADVARQAVVDTLTGSAQLLAVSSEDPASLRARVTSPGGTTAAAIRVLDDAAVPRTLVAAITAARDRGRELAAG